MKKFIAPALALILCASLLVGCGCSGNVAMTTEPTTVPTTAPTTAPTTEPTTAPTTEATTHPTAAPDTGPTETTGIMDDITGTDGNTDGGDGTIPGSADPGNHGRRFR